MVRGAVAGLLGSGMQDVLFAATKVLAPGTTLAEREANPGHKGPHSTVRVGRGAYAALTGRALPVSDATIDRVLHYAYGAGWGALFGLAAERVPRLRTPGGAAAYGLFVWAVSENLLMPALRITAPPQRYPAYNHAYAIAGHLAYAATLRARMRSSRD